MVSMIRFFKCVQYEDAAAAIVLFFLMLFVVFKNSACTEKVDAVDGYCCFLQKYSAVVQTIYCFIIIQHRRHCHNFSYLHDAIFSI